MFAEDLQPYLADFGVPCVAGSVTFTGLLDQPDELLDLTRVNVHSRQYELTYITAQAALVREQDITVNGVAYIVREAPRQVDDGVFSRAILTRS